MRHFKENLLVQFSLTSFVVMAVMAIIVSVFMTDKIQSHAISDLVEEAVGTSSARLHRAITPLDLQIPMTGERYAKFNDFLQESIVSERTARVKIFANDGTVVYSTDQTQVGQKFPDKLGLITALSGEEFTDISVPNDVDNERDRELGTLFEVYTPIVFAGNSEPQGAFEIYQFYAPTAQRLNELRLWTFGIVGLGFLTLYAALVFIVWKGWRTITNQRAQLQTVNSELGASLDELHGSNRRLERSNQELQEFASIAAHDLQEPLRKVEAFGDRLQVKCGDQLSDQGRDYLSRMQNAAGRMRSLIEDLLSYSRVASKGEAFTPVDLYKVTQGVLSDLEIRIEQVGGRVEVDDLPTIDADPTQMRQLLQNLIGNSLKFHRPEEPPVIKIHGQNINGHSNDTNGSNLNDELYEIVVEDNGIGFEEEYLDSIFTIFQRLHGLGEYEGNGVGLAVCRKIAERHGGNITAKGTPGEGAKFIITLPKTHLSEVDAE